MSQVSFTATTISGLQVQFTDTSAGSPNRWDWSFRGPGLYTSDSTVQNPIITFSTPDADGTDYCLASLIVWDVAGTYLGSLSRRVNITNGSATVPQDAMPYYTVSVSGTSVTFTDASVPAVNSTIFWDFFNNPPSPKTLTYANNQNHIAKVSYYSSSSSQNGFTYLGTYSVAFTVGTPPDPLVANFTHTPDPQITGSNVSFTDTSSGGLGNDAWYWSFDDGDISTSQNPTHSYSSSGSYSVRLITWKAPNSWDSSAVIHSVTISNVTAAFTANKGLTTDDAQLVGQSISFTDQSTGGPSTWAWDFGDGNTSATQNPNHTYSSSGTKTVTLTVT